MTLFMTTFRQPNLAEKVPNESSSSYGWFLRWQAPPVKWVKLSTDGSCWSNLSFASTEQRWLGISIIGYGKNIGSCNAAMAELWAIFDGLQLLWPKGARHVLLECDSKFFVQACTSEDESHGNYVLTLRIKEILRRNWTVHVTIETSTLLHICWRFLQDPKGKDCRFIQLHQLLHIHWQFVGDSRPTYAM
ncbi:hypothetical protein PVK06_038513 [Gossypium arboreum]|uniref:RNase H type-1 domain-containing protein n=1 Tax=Gossypium arboreum TaxID=29729 RepID=A0ABR0N0C0_GOSAR|nr:hypothetical protein PVK06_038513 [Gossypium arboreum]